MNEDSSEYQKIFQEIRAIVYPNDLDSHPVKEYGPEVTRLAAFVIQQRQKNHLEPIFLEKEIHRIWDEYFHKNCSDAQRIANEIVKKLGK
ncbi:MAG: hypothetical protein HYZ85_04635 [Candidatus Omnitrophica bacterium]|nr:hypothetical protein [Candidatus Omnitrophota bacterium]